MLKKILQSVREYKRSSYLAPLFAGIESIFDIIVPTVMAYLIDYGIAENNMGNILKYGAMLVASAFISMALGFFAGKNTAIAASGFARNLRNDVFQNIQQFSFSNIDKFSTASIITRLTTDVANVQNAYQMTIRIGARAPMMMAFALFFAFRIHARLSLIFLGIIVFLTLGLLLVINHVHPIFVRVFRRYDNLNNVVQENLLGIRVVKNFTREEHEIGKFTEISLKIYDDFNRAVKRLALNAPLMQFCLYTSTVLLAWFGSKEIVAAGNNPAFGLTTGQLTSLITYTMQILMSLMLLSNVFVLFIISRASVERIVEVMEETSDLQNGPDPILNVPDGSITFEDVTFRYSRDSEKPVLDRINLTINSGETIGILGGTGSSKSTLVQLIPRLYDVVEGRVTVGGIDVRDYDLVTLRDQVAVVLQKNILFSGTIKENLRWGNENATDEEMIRACEIAQADEFIRQMPEQYDAYIERGGSNLSGGQRQRLCIARALLKNPKVLIFDDSTSAVDTKTDQRIREGLSEVIPGTTKIIIAQRVASVEDADKIIVMDDGKISAVGTHEELLTSSSIYKEVYDSQKSGGSLDG
ncbi:MAG: ABC transporter ATP-binding protein [Clostridia bacterium]|jgi:ATP-binding cassette subfamily B protein|nr:ABC transporter ATP-binding protein [Clostridia bacterium]